MVRQPFMPRHAWQFALCTAIAGALLQGCAIGPTAAWRCEGADWEQIGFGDGLAGAGPTAAERYRVPCARQGVVLDLVAYQAGVVAGLRRYCQPATAYGLGAEGASLPDHCPADLSVPFAQAYAEGREAWEARSALRSLNRVIRRTQQEIDAMEIDLQALQESIRVPGLPLARRVEYASTANDLRHHLQSLRAQMATLDGQLDARQQAVAAHTAHEGQD